MADAPKSNEPQVTAEMLSAFGTMLTWLFIATVGMMLILAIPAGIAYSFGWHPSIMVYVVLSGALGGFVSSLSRIYSLRELPALLVHPDFKLIRNRYVAMYALIPPLIGIVASAFIYIAVAAGIIDGDLFANFHCLDVDCNNGLSGLMNYGPETVRDYAKVLIWGFASGFSERFFPGVIDSLTQQKRGTQ